MSNPPSYLQFWGKSDRTEGGRWHPAAFHMLDVAACAEQLLASRAKILSRMSDRIAVDPDSLARSLVALIGLHDLAKFSRAFQVKAPWLWTSEILGEIPPADMRPRGRHDADLLSWLYKRHARQSPLNPLAWPLFKEWAGTPWGDVAPLLGAVAGHHGEPVEVSELDTSRIIGSAAEQAAAAFVADWLTVLGDPALPLIDPDDAPDFAWSLVGLTVVSDWLGSGQRHFPLMAACGERIEISLQQYWDTHAGPAAQRALAQAGLSPIAPSRVSTVSALAGLERKRPLQEAAEDLPLPSGPLLIIVEDVTGAGKTEAALVLAHRLMVRGDAGGLYMAMPTMATANAMFERLQRCLANLFAQGSAPSLALAHGKARLHPAFRSVRLPQERGGAREEPMEVAAACADWIADDRRKAFFAHVGAGTIDQALLAILPARYQSLRLFGLAERVLIVDEAHSYDAYSSELLAKLISFQAALGGSTILLSATLSSRERNRLAQAYAQGRGIRGPLAESGAHAQAYPMVSVAAGPTLARAAVAPVEALRRRVVVERIADVAAAEADLIRAHRSGTAVAYVRNSVQDAIETTERLRAQGLDPLLFHARFAMGDRLAIEGQVKRLYGRAASAEERCSRPLVATQVVEQSLDLDFDLMLTDLAPVDLLIQRAGRVWRHMAERPAHGRPNGAPTLRIVSPDPFGEVTVDWMRALLPRAAGVYPDHALLWRSANVLFAAGAIEAPDDLRRFVERVYADTLEPSLETPAGLQRGEGKAYGERSAHRTHARSASLVLEEGYIPSAPWRDEAKVTTRLGEDRITIRLARCVGAVILPWFGDDDPALAWALSEVDAAIRHVKTVNVPERFISAVERVRERFGRFEKETPLLVLEPDGTGQWCGSGLDAAGSTITLRYDEKAGLRFLPQR